MRMPSHRLAPLLLLCSLAAGCSLAVRNQPLPEYPLEPLASDFVVPREVAVLHYYGAGGWGIQWRDTYVLTAPYFSNHNLLELRVSTLRPDTAAIQAGFRNTPVARTGAILVGHGHIDHAGDVPGFFAPGLIEGRPSLIADVSTVNMLAPLRERFSCVAGIDYFGEGDVSRCTPPGVRITPLHSAHAPHVRIGGIDFAAFGGSVKEPQQELPRKGEDFRLGGTWAFLIDLLDEQGRVAFRIHYVDAAASPPHGFASHGLLAERDVDVQILCMPAYDLVEDYPRESLTHHRARYAFAAHWENIFRPRHRKLELVPVVLTESKLGDFIDHIERALGTRARGVAPLNKSEAHCGARPCGPRGATWSMPAPGETFQFTTGPQAPLPEGPLSEPPRTGP